MSKMAAVYLVQYCNTCMTHDTIPKNTILSIVQNYCTRPLGLTLISILAQQSSNQNEAFEKE